MALEMQIRNRVGAMARMAPADPGIPIRSAKKLEPPIITDIPAIPMATKRPKAIQKICRTRLISPRARLSEIKMDTATGKPAVERM